MFRHTQLSIRNRGLAVLLGVACVFAITPASSANAHTGAPPWDTEPVICAWDDLVVGCFEQDGDDIWVYDAESDGASAVVVWWTSDGQSGSCRNSHGVATWHECDAEMTEGKTVYWVHRTFDADTGGWVYLPGTASASTSS